MIIYPLIVVVFASFDQTACAQWHGQFVDCKVYCLGWICTSITMYQERLYRHHAEPGRQMAVLLYLITSFHHKAININVHHC